MALVPVNSLEIPGHKGKGLSIGSIAGGVLGAIAGGVAGGPGGAISGAGAGASLGGMIGNQADPSTAGIATQNTSVSEAGMPEKTVPLQRFENHPEVQLAQLQTAREALSVEPSLTMEQRKALNNDFLESAKLIQNSRV